MHLLIRIDGHEIEVSDWHGPTAALLDGVPVAAEVTDLEVQRREEAELYAEDEEDPY